MFNVKIIKSNLIVKNKEPLAAGASKVYHVSFDFDEEWNGLLKNVIFKAGETSISVLLEGETCAIPWEVLSSENIGEKLWIGVYGSDTQGTKLPTIWNELEIIQAGAELCGSGSEPTPTAVSLIYDTAKNAESMAKNAVEEASKAGEYAAAAEESKKDAEKARDEAKTAVGNAQGYARLASDEYEKAKAEATEAKESATEAAQSATEAAASAALAAEKAAETKKQCANALRSTLFGASVSADDVSPMEHELDLRVECKNIMPGMYEGRADSDVNGLKFTYAIDGSITVTGTATAKTVHYVFNGNNFLLPRDAMFSGYGDLKDIGSNDTVRIILHTIQPNGQSTYNGTPTNITQGHVTGKIAKGSTVVGFYFDVAQGYSFPDEGFTFYPQLEYGDEITAFVPTVNLAGSKVNITDGENTVTLTADENGNVMGAMSMSPNMTVSIDDPCIVLECTYNRDTNKVIENLTNAIISLGGNI